MPGQPAVQPPQKYRVWRWPGLSFGDAAISALALGGPIVLTVILQVLRIQERDFLYMGLVAVTALFGGLPPALFGAALSFLLVDWFFVPPVGTFTIADREDVVNLLVFFGTAVLVGVLASFRRTAQIRAQTLARQLERANAELMRFNREQAKAAQAALRVAQTEHQVRVLQDSERFRRELLANVSHDLRTPIATILTESTGMLGEPSLHAEMRQRLEAIASEARRLGTLVGDMLDLSRIEGGALELDLEPVRLEDAVASAVERLHHSSPGRQVITSFQEPEIGVLADWVRLGQVFDNLLSNADRFASASTPIAIDVALEQPGVASIRVSDQGPGIDPAIKDQLFTRFLKVPAKSSGTGLGLAIVKGLVEAHAGQIELEERGQGATFRFTLPLAEVPAVPS